MSEYCPDFDSELCTCSLEQENKQLKEENDTLKRALRKCSPTSGFGNCWSCGLRFNVIHDNIKNGNAGHKDDCEYARLISDVE